MPSFILVAVTNTLTKSCGGKGLLAHNSRSQLTSEGVKDCRGRQACSFFHTARPLSKEPASQPEKSSGNQSGHCSTGARQVYFSASFLNQPGPPAQGMVLSSVGWALLHQQSRLSPTDMPMGQLDLNNSLLRLSSWVSQLLFCCCDKTL